jgi:predicted transcriptional regulator
VEKDPEGFYFATPYGKLILSFLPGLSFVAKHPDYFMDHDLSLLPPGFLARLGELSNCNFGEGTISNLDVSRKITMEARERLYMISREVPADTGVYHSKVSEGVELRVLLHENALPSGPEADRRRATAPHVLRITSTVPIIMVITENAAALMFPNRKGMFDFSAGFSSMDPSFRGWCEELYQYLWDQGRDP